MIGAEFLGMIMLIVYVGAVAVLFLFVVMMLNVNEDKSEKYSKKNISVGTIAGLVIFLELLVAIGGWKYKNYFVSFNELNSNQILTNTHQLGGVLYTDYIHLFQISGMILLIAMIGAIALTFNKKENVKRQSYFKQIQRDRATSIELVEVEKNKGVKIDD